MARATELGLCYVERSKDEDPNFDELWGWCGREDLNLHTLSGTCTSSMRVCQFRHDRLKKLIAYTSFKN